MMLDWKSLIPEPPSPAPSHDDVQPDAAPIEPRRVPVAEPEPEPINNESPEYWQRKATPAEIKSAEAYRDALERRDEQEERRLRALERAGRRERQS